MSALWIRVDADEVSSVRMALLADALGVPPVYALGHVTALGGKVAHHQPDGDLSAVPDALLELWGLWQGERGRFARAVREQLVGADGRLRDWTDSMGKLVEMRERDRRRKRTDSAEAPRNLPADSGATERTERNGTNETERRSGARARDEGPAAAPPAAPPPPAAQSGESADGPAHDGTLPAPALALLARAYVGAGHEVLVDKRRQLDATLTDRGARLEGQEYVRAVDAAHLGAACAHVLGRLERGEIRKPATAVRLVLLELRDTRTEVLAGRERQARGEPRAGPHAPRRRGPSAEPTALADVVSPPPPAGPTASDRAERELRAWAVEHPDTVRAVKQRVVAEHPDAPADGLFVQAAVRSALREAMLADLERREAPQHAGAAS